MNKTKLIILVLLAMLTGGCQSVESTPSPLPDNWQQCPEKRSKMCTKEYRPVCAFNSEKQNWQMAPTGCVACSDEAISGYVPGACQL